jgi:hypothetical protein
MHMQCDTVMADYDMMTDAQPEPWLCELNALIVIARSIRMILDRHFSHYD